MQSDAATSDPRPSQDQRARGESVEFAKYPSLSSGLTVGKVTYLALCLQAIKVPAKIMCYSYNAVVIKGG